MAASWLDVVLAYQKFNLVTFYWNIFIHCQFNSGMGPTMWNCFFHFYSNQVFNISWSWWPFQCLNPRQRYQARLLVEEGGVISIDVVRVTYRKPGCGPLWIPYVGVYVLQLLWGMWYLLDIVIISVLLWLTCTNHWLDMRQTWLILLIIAAASYVLSNTIYWYVMKIKHNRSHD